MQHRGPGVRDVKLDLQYQNTIPGPPENAGNLYQRACSGDGVTVETWRKTWIGNYQKNHDRFGSFADHSIGKLFGVNRYRPCVALGSGPSLKHALPALKENKELDHPVTTISCLHNYALLEDEGCHADYYVTLDAGDVVLHDAVEFGKDKGKDYWATTKDKVLLAYAATPTELFDKWQGKVYIFNCLVPDEAYRNETDKIESFRHYVSSGGNCLGACVYIAKTIFSSDPVMFVGADFCFDYGNKNFHPTDTKYDNFSGVGIGNVIMATDVFGNARVTWPSYYNFKCFFDDLTRRCPGRWINCSEGLLGAYKEGNIETWEYRTLSDALLPYKMSNTVFYAPTVNGKQGDVHKIHWKDVFADSKYEHHIVMY